MFDNDETKQQTVTFNATDYRIAHQFKECNKGLNKIIWLSMFLDINKETVHTHYVLELQQGVNEANNS